MTLDVCQHVIIHNLQDIGLISQQAHDANMLILRMCNIFKVYPISLACYADNICIMYMMLREDLFFPHLTTTKFLTVSYFDP